MSEYQGNPGEDATAPFWASGNYVGPYWSDGKVQPSVEWGDAPTLSPLDQLARQHDAVWAHWPDARHRAAADAIFAKEARKLGYTGRLSASNPGLAGDVVEYGNYTKNKFASTVKNYLTYGPLGLVKQGLENIYEMHKRLKGEYGTKETADVMAFLTTDPKRNTVAHGGTRSSDRPVDRRPSEPAPPRKPAGPGKELVPPKRGPMARVVDEALVIDAQRKHFDNYQKLHAAAQKSLQPGQPRSARVEPDRRVGWRAREAARVKLKNKNKPKRNRVMPLYA